MNRNLVGSTYGRLSIKFPQNRMKDEWCRLSTEPLVFYALVMIIYGNNNYNLKKIFYKQHIPIIVENRISDRHPMIPINQLLFISRFPTLAKSDLSTCELFQWVSNIRIQVSVLVQYKTYIIIISSSVTCSCYDIAEKLLILCVTAITRSLPAVKPFTHYLFCFCFSLHLKIRLWVY
jgi:hypothetical protein